VTALYGLLILEAGFQWYYATLIFCSQGDSRLSLFFGSAAGALSIPPTITIISIVVENLGFLLADRLMVLSTRLFIQFVSNSRHFLYRFGDASMHVEDHYSSHCR